MKHITRKISITAIVILNCLLIMLLHSCKGNSDTSNYTRCEDSLSMYTKAATVSKDTITIRDTTAIKNTSIIRDTITIAKDHKSGNTGNKPGAKSGLPSTNPSTGNSTEPTGPGTLKVTSTAFENNGVIPIKYTCDGSGVTPPLNVANIPVGTKSLTLIVYDYHDTPHGGRTFWIIWNINPNGIIPENFHSDHEGMNAAKQYGNTPICSKSGNHKYHFIVYALECNLVVGKNTTKSAIEKVMRGHVLAKGELVGVYNRRLD